MFANSEHFDNEQAAMNYANSIAEDCVILEYGIQRIVVNRFFRISNQVGT